MYPNSVYLLIPLYLPLIPAVPPTKKKKSKQEEASKQKQDIKILFAFPFTQLSTTSLFILVALGASASYTLPFCHFD